MIRREWIRSGIVEEIDARQQQLLDLVLDRIRFYYRELYRTRACYAHPLSLARLMRMSRRSGYAVTLAVKILANTVVEGESSPSVFYERVPSIRNPAKRSYRIFLR